MKTEEVKNLIANLHDKEEYVIHVGDLKQALNHGLVLKNVHRAIKFNQIVWLKSYIDMKTELIKKAKNDLEKDFFKFIINAIFGKTKENVRKQRYQTCNNRNKKSLFGIKTKLLYNNIDS